MKWLSFILKTIIVWLVKFYQLAISPYLGRSCRFTPTCSNYMIEAVTEWGPFRGFWMGLKRIGECHPWGSHGHDPVPKNPDKELKTNHSINK